MAVAKNKERVTITLTHEMMKWLEGQAGELGVTVSMIISMSVRKDREMQEGMSIIREMGGLNNIAAALNDMQKNIIQP